MKCPMETRETSELLLAYCARRLDPETAAWLERHIASCAACGETFRAQARVWQALDEWEAAEISPDFNRRLYRAIDEQARTSWWQRIARAFEPFSVHRGLPVAAAACLLIMAGVIVRQREAPTAPAPAAETVRVESVAVDQVEKSLEDLELLRDFNTNLRAAAQQSNSL